MPKHLGGQPCRQKVGAALFGDAACVPIAGPVCDVITIAKKDLKPGDIIDGIGGFSCYGMIENSEVCQGRNLLPMGLSEGAVLRREIKKDHEISYDDVDIPKGRLSDKLRMEQNHYFYSGR